jgi:hypothetical protein
MHQQEQRAAKLEQLMQKDLLIRVALYCYTFGRFTYSQVCAHACALCSAQAVFCVYVAACAAHCMYSVFAKVSLLWHSNRSMFMQ